MHARDGQCPVPASAPGSASADEFRSGHSPAISSGRPRYALSSRLSTCTRLLRATARQRETRPPSLDPPPSTVHLPPTALPIEPPSVIYASRLPQQNSCAAHELRASDDIHVVAELGRLRRFDRGDESSFVGEIVALFNSAVSDDMSGYDKIETASSFNLRQLLSLEDTWGNLPEVKQLRRHKQYTSSDGGTIADLAIKRRPLGSVVGLLGEVKLYRHAPARGLSSIDVYEQYRLDLDHHLTAGEAMPPMACTAPSPKYMIELCKNSIYQDVGYLLVGHRICGVPYGIAFVGMSFSRLLIDSTSDWTIYIESSRPLPIPAAPRADAVDTAARVFTVDQLESDPYFWRLGMANHLRSPGQSVTQPGQPWSFPAPDIAHADRALARCIALVHAAARFVHAPQTPSTAPVGQTANPALVSSGLGAASSVPYAPLAATVTTAVEAEVRKRKAEAEVKRANGSSARSTTSHSSSAALPSGPASTRSGPSGQQGSRLGSGSAKDGGGGGGGDGGDAGDRRVRSEKGDDQDDACPPLTHEALEAMTEALPRAGSLASAWQRGHEYGPSGLSGVRLDTSYSEMSSSVGSSSGWPQGPAVSDLIKVFAALDVRFRIVSPEQMDALLPAFEERPLTAVADSAATGSRRAKRVSIESTETDTSGANTSGSSLLTLGSSIHRLPVEGKDDVAGVHPEYEADNPVNGSVA